MDNKYSDEYLEELGHKYKKGILTKEEQAEFDAWYLNHDDTVFEHSGAIDPGSVKSRIYAKILTGLENEEAKSKVKIIRLFPRIAAVAAIICTIIGTSLFFYYNSTKIDQAPIYANDVAPGKNGATLTLSNGAKIRLTDALNGQVAQESGVSISKTADGQLVYTIKQGNDANNKINILNTEKGETYQVRLPDGSLIWLNAASSLRYPANFTSLKERRVELSGEAYFEIAKDKTHPFIVKTGKQEVEVLGTHFNIEAYDDENAIRTTLLEGSVKLSAGFDTQLKERILKPDQQALFIANQFNIKQVDAEDAIAWKNGLFVFEDEPLESVMKKVARWYNVEIVYQDVDKNKSFFGSMSRYDNVSKVLDGLQLTNGARFKIEGRRITVMK